MCERASVSVAFVAFAYNRVGAVTLGTAGSILILAFKVALALLIAVQEVRALVRYAASRHALKTKLTDVLLLFASMQADSWICAAEV